MATHTAHVAQTATLTGGAADTITFDSYGVMIQVVHHNTTTDPIYFTIGSAATAATPVSEADDNYVVMPGTSLNVSWPLEVSGVSGGAVVKLISAGNVKYTVQVLNVRWQ